jgi:hypothetical protein
MCGKWGQGNAVLVGLGDEQEMHQDQELQKQEQEVDLGMVVDDEAPNQWWNDQEEEQPQEMDWQDEEDEMHQLDWKAEWAEDPAWLFSGESCGRPLPEPCGALHGECDRHQNWRKRKVQFHRQQEEEQGIHTGQEERREILVDSGAFTHVCPEDFSRRAGTIPVRKKFSIRTASGQPVVHLGNRLVEIDAGGGQTLKFEFAVCAGIKRPIISVGAFVDQGVAVSFDEHAHIRVAQATLDLIQRNQVFFLPAQCRALEPDGLHELQGGERRRSKKPVVEWACSQDSRLSNEFSQQNGEALRLSWPQWDLSRPIMIHQIVERLCQFLDEKRRVLIWASLPCHAWCRWHHVTAS